MLRFRYSSLINAPIEVVFGFHERPDAIELLTPAAQKLAILHKKNGLEVGARVEMRIAAGPFRLRWIALHTAYEKNRLFVDEQLYGPFRRWIHEHQFTAEDGATRLTDAIRFSLPGGWPTDILFGWTVKLHLRRMFRYRHEVTRRECERGAGSGLPG